MEQIIITNGQITDHIDAPNLQVGATAVSNFTGVVGSYVDEYDSNWVLLPLAQRILLGRASMPEGYTYTSDKLDIRQMSYAERIAAGLDILPDGYEIVGDVVQLTLATIKSIKKDEIKTAYNDEKTTTKVGIMSEALGVKIDCRELDHTQTQALITYLESKGLTSTNKYKVFDNSYITATTDQLKQVLVEINNFQVELWGKKDAILNKINSLTTVEAVQAVVWE